jgi:Terminase-like family.
LALYEPVDEMIEKLLVPELDEILDASGLKYTLRASAPRKYVIDFPHGRAVIYLNSFENWRRIVGGNYCFAGVDEIDTVQRRILDLSWKKLVGRVRVGHCNQIFCTTTPEGFNFAYDFLVVQK